MGTRWRAAALVIIVVFVLLAVWTYRSGLREEEPKITPVTQTPPGKQAPPEAASTAPDFNAAEAARIAPPEILPATLPAAIAGKCQSDSMALAKSRAAAAPEGMVYVAGGPFIMGDSAGSDNAPARNVCINGFYIDKYEVTNAQFKKFVDATSYVTDAERTATSADSPTWCQPYGPDSNADKLPNCPVTCVSWNDASAYAHWVNKRLPTEAEWEKAARGTNGRIYPWGNTEPTGSTTNVADKTMSVKWSSTALNDNFKTAAPVGSFPQGKSAYGIEDMAGNVWEWCADWWSSDFYKNSSPTNPLGPENGEYKCIRGGSWFYSLDGAKATQRMYFRPEGSSAAIGFRCAEDA